MTITMSTHEHNTADALQKCLDLFSGLAMIVCSMVVRMPCSSLHIKTQFLNIFRNIFDGSLIRRKNNSLKFKKNVFLMDMMS